MSLKHKCCWLSKIDVLGAHLSVESLKVGVTYVRFKPFPPQGEAGSWGSLPLRVTALSAGS